MSLQFLYKTFYCYYFVFLLQQCFIVASAKQRNFTTSTTVAPVLEDVPEEQKANIGAATAKLTCPALKQPSENVNTTLNQTDQESVKRPMGLRGFDSVLWIVDRNEILVGAGIEYDRNKYEYHPAAGQLVIRDIDFSDLGVYHCIPRFGEGNPGDQPGLELASVRLVAVKGADDWYGWYKENEEMAWFGGIGTGIGLGCAFILWVICKFICGSSEEEVERQKGTPAVTIQPEKPRTLLTKATNTSIVPNNDDPTKYVYSMDFDEEDEDENVNQDLKFRSKIEDSMRKGQPKSNPGMTNFSNNKSKTNAYPLVELGRDRLSPTLSVSSSQV